MEIFLVVLLTIFGIGLLMAEIFLIPGFGIAGVTGILSLAGSVFCGYYFLGAVAGHITLGAVVLLSALTVYVFLKNKTLDKMALQTDIDAKVDGLAGCHFQIGDQGICVSRLAPMGKVRINGQEVEAKSQDAFVEAKTKIEIVAIESNKVIVKPIE